MPHALRHCIERLHALILGIEHCLDAASICTYGLTNSTGHVHCHGELSLAKSARLSHLPAANQEIATRRTLPARYDTLRTCDGEPATPSSRRQSGDCHPAYSPGTL